MRHCPFLNKLSKNVGKREMNNFIKEYSNSIRHSSTITDKESKCPFLKAAEKVEPKLNESMVAKINIKDVIKDIKRNGQLAVPHNCPFHQIVKDNNLKDTGIILDHLPTVHEKTKEKVSNGFSYSNFFQSEIDKKVKDNSYRVFKKLLRKADNFPYAKENSVLDHDVAVWCSNDYLGMSWHPQVMEAAIEAIKNHGTGSGGTRNISGNTIFHEKLEHNLARLHGKESALVFTSCYVANEASLHTLGSRLPQVHIFSDSGNHASMIHGIRTSRAAKSIFRHNDAAHLDELLSQHRSQSESHSSRPNLVAFETVHSMTGDICPIHDLLNVCHKHNALSFVDEVHAVGLYGDHGAGVAERDSVMNKIDLITGTLGKAFGNVGGYIAGDKDLVDMIRSYASGFIFTTSLPPSVLAAANTAINVLASDEGRELRTRHQLVVKKVKTALIQEGIPVIDCPSHIIPVHVGNPRLSTHLSNELLNKYKIYVQAINHPTVEKGDERLRIAPSPHHTDELIGQLVEAMVELWQDNKLPLMRNVSHNNSHNQVYSQNIKQQQAYA